MQFSVKHNNLTQCILNLSYYNECNTEVIYLNKNRVACIYRRRSNPKKLFLQVPHYCAAIHKSKVHFNNSFSYDAPKLWNDLPHDIHSAPNLLCFKSRLKTYLFQKSFPP